MAKALSMAQLKQFNRSYRPGAADGVRQLPALSALFNIRYAEKERTIEGQPSSAANR